MNVADWLQTLGLEQYEAAFRANDINSELLPDLTADDLKDLGITSIGHRRRLLDAVVAMRSQATPPGTAAPPVSSPPIDPNDKPGAPETIAERRPLSVMFCDLVGSTALSSRLDLEDLQEVMRIYETRVATTIQHFDGFVARYVGDGVLIYFGWPHAHETDAVRAVRAGLAVAAAIDAAPMAGEALQVRIGIATGLVVVGESVGSGGSGQRTAIGEAPNRAARLQSLASPNQVVIDLATRRQIGNLFDCKDLGTVALKGLPAAVPAWRVMSENRALGQFEALRSGLTPLVGRDEEMELLLRRWAQTKSGSGEVVLISAEPGVGKSRLAEALAERIATEPHLRLRYFCSPHHQDSALYPVIAQMERAAGFAQTDAPTARIAKLKSLLAVTGPPLEDVALIAQVHGLPSADPVSPLDLTPQRRKEKLFDALLHQLEGLVGRRPVLMVFDDIHWIDPSSRELLDRLIQRVADWPVLLLVLFRPEVQPPWVGQPHVTLLTLARLDRHDATAMIANVAGDTALPSEIVAEIAERTDGVPLFIEELTKAVLEARLQAPAGLSAKRHSSLSVPATLHGSLIARLDRLGPTAREVAQVGATIGREFAYELLAFVTDLSEPQLREALDRLINAGLVFARGMPPHASYLFKHALVQDTAYGSLLRNRRQNLHRRIVATLEERFPEIVLAQPALLAQHCVAAGLAEEAVTYWLAAGQQALARSMMAEAVVLLHKGLEMLTDLSDSPRRGQQELDLHVTLASAFTAAKGWSTGEVAETLARARALAEQFDRPEYLVPLLVGQWGVHCARAEHRLVLPLSEQLEKIGRTQNNVTAELLAYIMRGATYFYLGDFVAARTLLERCMDFADPVHRTSAGLSFDPYAAALTYLALTMGCLGYIDQGRACMDTALSEARRIRHFHTLAHGLCFASWLDWLTCSSMAHIEEFQTISDKNDFPLYMGWARAFHGKSILAPGHAEEGLAQLMQGLEQIRSVEGSLCLPMLFTWLGQAYDMLRQPEGRDCLAEAARLIEDTGERVIEAELHRVSGDLLKDSNDQFGAERHYRQAIAVADRQSAKLLQLRAATSLARLWRNQGKRAEACELLAPIYGWFTEGFDAPVLKDAKTLLDELA